MQQVIILGTVQISLLFDARTLVFEGLFFEVCVLDAVMLASSREPCLNCRTWRTLTYNREVKHERWGKYE